MPKYRKNKGLTVVSPFVNTRTHAPVTPDHSPDSTLPHSYLQHLPRRDFE